MCLKLLREALTNVAWHACAACVRIESRETATVFRASITDDRCGLSANARAKPDSLGRLGLAARLEAIGGSLTVANAEPHGVKVSARIPLR